MLYLDIPTADDYADLGAWRGDMAVSIALPTTPVSIETDADRIQLENLARGVGPTHSGGRRQAAPRFADRRNR